MGVGAPGAGVTGVCKPLDRMLGTKVGSSAEAVQVLLAAYHL